MRGPEGADVQDGGQLEVQGEGRQTGPGISAGATRLLENEVHKVAWTV